VKTLSRIFTAIRRDDKDILHIYLQIFFMIIFGTRFAKNSMALCKSTS
jgi:hypothetical protein